jgi:Na+/proline symporter
MELIDWIILFGTLLGIVGYGTWKTRQQSSMSGYLKGDNSMKWYTIGLSIMATQASAITFLSTPGQAYESGMGFVQFYFGLPLAVVVISAVFIPLYYKLNVFTAYEYLEKRFDIRVRLVTALLFLISRGLAAGITIYAPAIVLSTLLGWNLTFTNLLVGVLVIIYTVSGGTKAVSMTQKWQMGVIFLGMFIAFFLILDYLPDELSFTEAVNIAGFMGKMEIVDTTFDLDNRYTLWTGLLGGFFLSLSYFGTDQSQVQRYLGGKSVTESRLGLLFNAILKIPMQFFILMVGIMVFVFYQFNQPPAFFNQPGLERAKATELRADIEEQERRYADAHNEKQIYLEQYLASDNENEKALAAEQAAVAYQKGESIRGELKELLVKADSSVETKDTDYVFLTFILNYLPHGIIGLLLAVILSAAMSSTAGELNALASTTVVDYYKRLGKKESNNENDVRMSKLFTLIWGLLAIGIALSANLFENLIQLVNVLGSLFYGTILGVFIVAFFLKRVGGTAVLIGAIIGELFVLTLHLLTVLKVIDISYLWYNVLGCLVVVFISFISQQLLPNVEETKI